MLIKIFIFTFFGTVIYTYFLALGSSEISNYFDKFTVKIDVLGLGIPIAYVVPALVIALTARIIKLHDKISDLFRIRESFDIQEILNPLAGGVEYPVSLRTIEYFNNNRDDLMSSTFYRYASSKKPQIDSHLIEMALDKWSWFWVLIELISVGAIALIVLLFLGAHQVASWLATALFAGTLLASFVNRICAKVAHAEVQAILSNPQWHSEVKTTFNALSI